MPVFFYDANGKLRVIPDAERDARKGSSGSGNKKNKLPPLPHGTIRVRAHKGNYPTPSPGPEQPPKKPNPGPEKPGPEQPSPKRLPAPGHPPTGRGKGPEQKTAPKFDPIRILLDSILRNTVRSNQRSIQQPTRLHSQITHSHLPASRPIPMRPVNNLPKAEYHVRGEGKVNLWEKLELRQPFNDGEMKQLFHAIDLQKYGAQTAQAKQQVEMIRQYAEDKLARNLVDNAERTADGNVLLQGEPVRPEDAQYFARQDIQHFQNTNTHLRPSQITAHNADHNANTAYEFLNHPATQPTFPKEKVPSFIIKQSNLPKGVLLPEGVGINANIAEAQRHYGDLNWFYNQVKNRGPWDYKQRGPQYETFGNFHYGLIGAAIGFEEKFLLRAAGWAQKRAGTSKPSWGDPGVIILGGKPPYGDDPADQFWIRVGVHYYLKHRSSLP